MAFTRFSNDNARQKKKIEESVFSGIYHLNTPGNGINNNYIDDVNIRLQKWGANLHSNTCNLESNMKGLNIPLNRGTIESKKTISNSKTYNTSNFNTDETRTTFPVWKYRELPQQRYDHLFNNPQDHVFQTFDNNLNTRVLEKDFYDKNKK